MCALMLLDRDQNIVEAAPRSGLDVLANLDSGAGVYGLAQEYLVCKERQPINTVSEMVTVQTPCGEIQEARWHVVCL